MIGPTASGKTALALQLAHRYNAEIISADSRQVYRRMDIGTGKDLALYQEAKIAYHLIDIVEPTEEFNLYRYHELFFTALSRIASARKNAIIAGGTGLYISAMLEGYRLPTASRNTKLRDNLKSYSQEELNKELLALDYRPHNQTDLGERERTIRAIEVALARRLSTEQQNPPFEKPLIIGISLPMDTIREKIVRRLNEKMRNGLIDEVLNLRKEGISFVRLEALGLEYRYIALFLRGELSLAEMEKLLAIRIGQFSKRQMSWFRRMEKRGWKIHWLQGEEEAEKIITQEWE